MENFKNNLKDISAFVFDLDGVLSHTVVGLEPDGTPARTTNLRDGYAIRRAQIAGYFLGIISGGNSEISEKRYRRLGIKDIYWDSVDKVKDLTHFQEKYNLQSSQILFMGDDYPDEDIMSCVGVRTCPADAIDDIKTIADYISHHKGGEGCVRDIIEQTMRVQGTWYDKQKQVTTNVL